MRTNHKRQSQRLNSNPNQSTKQNNPSKTNPYQVFMTGISGSLHQKQIYAFLKSVEPGVVSVTLPRKASSGFAFIALKDKTSMDNLLRIKYLKLKGRELQVKRYAEGNKLSKARQEINGRRVFVYSIPMSAKDHELRAEFSKFGEVEEAYIIRDRVTKKSQSFGYVLDRDVEVARKVALMKKVAFKKGKKVKVKMHQRKGEKGERREEGGGGGRRGDEGGMSGAGGQEDAYSLSRDGSGGVGSMGSREENYAFSSGRGGGGRDSGRNSENCGFNRPGKRKERKRGTGKRVKNNGLETGWEEGYVKKNLGVKTKDANINYNQAQQPRTPRELPWDPYNDTDLGGDQQGKITQKIHNKSQNGQQTAHFTSKSKKTKFSKYHKNHNLNLYQDPNSIPCFKRKANAKTIKASKTKKIDNKNRQKRGEKGRKRPQRRLSQSPEPVGSSSNGQSPDNDSVRDHQLYIENEFRNDQYDQNNDEFEDSSRIVSSEKEGTLAKQLNKYPPTVDFHSLKPTNAYYFCPRAGVFEQREPKVEFRRFTGPKEYFNFNF